MKTNIFLLLLITQLSIATKSISQNIAINSTGNLPDTSAMLDVSSTVKGFLPPRMTTAQQNAIPLPAKGLMIYNTTDNTYKANTGTADLPVWTTLSFAGVTSNTLTSSANNITSTVNGTAATASAINSVSNTSTANSLATTVNGIAGAPVAIINSNTLSLSGSNLTSTVNGIASSAVDLSAVAGSSFWKLTGNAGITAANYTGTTNNSSFRFRTNNIERMVIDSTGAVGINTKTPGSALDVKGTLRLSGSTSGYVGFAPATAAGSTTYTLPVADGTSGQLLSTNGSGTLSWATAASSGSASGGWGITGNSGTTAGTNFIGTTDGQALVFKISNVQAGYLGLSGSSGATAFGVSSTAGYKSTAIGNSAAAIPNTEATALGTSATAAGYRSIAIGPNATASSTSSNNETIAIGYNASANSYQGIAIGSGSSTSTNNQTLAVGVSATASGYQSTAIGYGASATAQNSTAIGNGAAVSTANYISIGNTTVSAIRGQVNFTTYSDGRFKKNIKADVPGLDFILKLRPVTYTWDIHKFNAHNNGKDNNAIHAKYLYPDTAEEEAIRKKESITYTGFIAQEVEQAAQKSSFNFSGVLKPQDDKDAYSLSYAEFVVPLVKATQELNAKLEAQQKLIDTLISEIKELKNQAAVNSTK